MHHVSRPGSTPPSVPFPFEGHSRGLTQVTHTGNGTGTFHAAMATVELAPAGFVEPHLQSYEELVFILDGSPVLTINGVEMPLHADDCACVPIGAVHSWASPGGPSRWLDLSGPVPRGAGLPADAFFVAGPHAGLIRLGLHDHRAPHFNSFQPEQMDLASVMPSGQAGARVPSLGNSLQVFGGTTLKMLIDSRQGAFLANMFMCQFAPGMSLQPHDHPLEETFCVLDGEVAFVADGIEHLLRPGDVAFAGLGCIHSFENRSARSCRFLETRSPLPPVLHEARFNRDWAEVG